MELLHSLKRVRKGVYKMSFRRPLIYSTRKSQNHFRSQTRPYQYIYIYIYGAESKFCMERSAVFRTYGTKELRNCSCSGPLECDEIYKLYINMYKYIYIYCEYVCNIHLRDMLVEATHAGCRSFSLLICTYLHDILAVHLFKAGLPCMASSRALARTQPVASVIHRLSVRTCHLFTR